MEQFCAHCGASLSQEYKFCPKCGCPSSNLTVIKESLAESTRAVYSEEHAPAEWSVGDVLMDLYEVIGELGEGGMGRVYKVHHRGWNVELAVKSPKPEIFMKEAGNENFIREAETWVNLPLHPHIVSCYYVRTMGGIPRVFAEYVSGGSLADWIHSRALYAGDTRQSLERILDIAIQFSWGLQFAHEQGLIHQDVKPANVILTADGVAKVTDFGLAKARGGLAEDASGQSFLVTFGGMTPIYCSPEQASRQPLSRKTDIWSWAVSMLEMFAGEVTWIVGHVARDALEAYLDSTPIGVPPMPQAIVDLLIHCFEHDPKARPSSMGEIADRLELVYRDLIGIKYKRIQPKAAQWTADSLNNRALSFIDLGNKEEARFSWGKAISLDPHHPESTYNFGIHLWRSGLITDEEVVEMIEKMRASHQQNWLDEYLLALIHIERGDTVSALELLDQVSKQAIKEPEVGEAVKLAQQIPSYGSLRNLQANFNCWSKTGRWIVGETPHFTKLNQCFVPDRRWISNHLLSEFTIWSLPNCTPVFRLKDIIAPIQMKPGIEVRFKNSKTGLDNVENFISHESASFSIGVRDTDLLLSSSEENTPMVTISWEENQPHIMQNSSYGTALLNHTRYLSMRSTPMNDENILRVGDHVLHLKVVSLPFQERTARMRISPDGRYCLIGSSILHSEFSNEDLPYIVSLWEIATGRCLSRIEGPSGMVMSLWLDPHLRFALVKSCKSHYETQKGGCIIETTKWSDFTYLLYDLREGIPVWRRKGDAHYVGASLHPAPEEGIFPAELVQGTDHGWAEVLGDRDQLKPDPNPGEDWMFSFSSYVTSKHESTYWKERPTLTARTADGQYEMRYVPSHPRKIDCNQASLELWELPKRPRKLRSISCDDLVRQIQFVDSVFITYGYPTRVWPVPEKAQAAYRLSTLRSTEDLLVTENKVDYLLEEASKALSDLRFSDALLAVTKARELPGQSRLRKTLDAWENLYSHCVKTKLRTVWPRRPIQRHSSPVTCLSLNEYGSLAVSGDEDGNVIIHEIPSAHFIGKLPLHHRGIECVQFVDRDSILSAAGPEIQLWDSRTFKLIRVFEKHPYLQMVRSLSAPSWYLAGGYTMGLWDMRTGRCLRFSNLYEGPRFYNAFLSGDGRLALSEGDHYQLELLDVASQRTIRTFCGGLRHNRPRFAISENGKLIASSFENGTLGLFEVHGAKSGIARDVHASCLSIAPDCHWLVTGGAKEVRIWRINYDLSLDCIYTLDGHLDEVTSVQFSPDAGWIISASRDHTVRIWELDWELQAQDPIDWVESARPYLVNFLSLHMPFPEIESFIGRESDQATLIAALTPSGEPSWTEEDFQKLLYKLGCAGFGCLRSEDIFKKLKEIQSAAPELRRYIYRIVLLKAPNTTYTLTTGENHIGRADDNDIAINDFGLSRHHAVITVSPQGAILEDKNSRGGSRVNNVLVTQTSLRQGDHIALGGVQFKFDIEAC